MVSDSGRFPNDGNVLNAIIRRLFRCVISPDTAIEVLAKPNNSNSSPPPLHRDRGHLNRIRYQLTNSARGVLCHLVFAFSILTFKRAPGGMTVLGKIFSHFSVSHSMWGPPASSGLYSMCNSILSGKLPSARRAISNSAATRVCVSPLVRSHVRIYENKYIPHLDEWSDCSRNISR